MVSKLTSKVIYATVKSIRNWQMSSHEQISVNLSKYKTEYFNLAMLVLQNIITAGILLQSTQNSRSCVIFLLVRKIRILFKFHKRIDR